MRLNGVTGTGRLRWLQVIAVLLLTAPLSARQTIELQEGRATLVMPPGMQRALEAFDPTFEPRQLTDYPPWLWQQPCTPRPVCEEYTYRLDPRQIFFAVIGDFNGDGRADVVVDGDDPTTGRRLAILTSDETYVVSEIDVTYPLSAEVRAYRNGPAGGRPADLGVGVGLSLQKPGVIESRYEDEPLVLTHDAVIVSYFEKAGSIYYYRNGTWHRYTISD